MIDARLRLQGGWSNARILNLSSRGMMVRTTQVPARGTYVEICKGSHRLVAHVVWARQDRFGARTQEPIAADALLDRDGAQTPPAANLNDRRAAPRHRPAAEQVDHSRRRSSLLQFLAAGAFAVAAATLAFDAVRETLSGPVQLVGAALGRRH